MLNCGIPLYAETLGFCVYSQMQKSIKKTSLPIIFPRSSSARILGQAKRRKRRAATERTQELPRAREERAPQKTKAPPRIRLARLASRQAAPHSRRAPSQKT